MDKQTKILFDLLGLASIVGVGWGSYQLIKLVREEKAEKKSNVSGVGLKNITLTLTNNTNSNQTAYLFDSRGGRNNPNVGISSNINLFNQELSNKPKKLSKIEFRTIGNSGFSGVDGATPPPPPAVPAAPVAPAVAPVPVAPVVPPIDPATTSSKLNQSEAPFQLICLDASGNESVRQYTPMITAQQYQKGITSVNMDGTILDGECFVKYTMYPKSKIAIVLFYQDYPRSALLDQKKNKSQMKGESNPSEGGDKVKEIQTSTFGSKTKINKNLTNSIVGIAAVGTVGFLTYKYFKN